MECRITSIRIRPRSTGATLAETLMGMGVAGLLLLIVVSFMMFSGRSFAALFNYVDLNDVNRVAIDQITRDVRQANRVKAASSNSLTLEDSDGLDLTYTYSPELGTLSRSKVGHTKVILHNCDSLSFTLGQRNIIGGTYDIYPAATPENCKVVNVSWVCSRTIFGRKENSESVQTARIVIRKQGS